MRKLLGLPLRAIGAAYRAVYSVYEDFKLPIVLSLLIINFIITVAFSVDWVAKRAFQRDYLLVSTQRAHEQGMRAMELNFYGQVIQYLTPELQDALQRVCSSFGRDQQVLERLHRER